MSASSMAAWSFNRRLRRVPRRGRGVSLHVVFAFPLIISYCHRFLIGGKASGQGGPSTLATIFFQKTHPSTISATKVI